MAIRELEALISNKLFTAALFLFFVTFLYILYHLLFIMKYFFITLLFIFLFLLGCSSVVPSQPSSSFQGTLLPDLITHKEFFLNKDIAIEGTVTIGWSCTEVACGANTYNCNSCEGYFYLNQGDENIRIRIGETRSCRGTSDSSGNVHDITCTLPLDANERYKLFGTLRKEEDASTTPENEWNFIYYLAFNRAEPL